MHNIYDYKDIKAEFKDLDKARGIATGYFSAFGNVDSHGDIMMPGAFTKTVSEQGPMSKMPRIKHLQNHDGLVPIGKLNVLSSDSYGLYFESSVGTHTVGRDFIEMAESGLITENSIGYSTVKSNERNDGVREIYEVKLYEGSSLTFLGANQMAKFIGMKSDDIIAQSQKRLSQIEKFCRNTTATDETIEMLLLEVKQLNQLIFDLKSEATKPLKSTSPVKDEWMTMANILLSNPLNF